MLKTIDGLEYIEGTGKGSLYPVVLWHKSGMVMGLQLKFASNSAVVDVSAYARVQKFDKAGKDVVPDLKEVYDFVKRLPLTIASPTHVSGSIFSSQYAAKKFKDPKTDGEKFGVMYDEIVTKLSQKLHATKLKPEYTKALGRDMYWAHVGYEPLPEIVEPPDYDDQLDPSFDVLKLLAKKDPDSNV